VADGQRPDGGPKGAYSTIDNVGGGAANWNGYNVRLLIEQYAPGLASFFERTFDLGTTSSNSANHYIGPSLELRAFDSPDGFDQDENDLLGGLSELSNPNGTPDKEQLDQILWSVKIHLNIPNNWSDWQVVDEIISLVTETNDVGALFKADLILTENTKLLETWQRTHFAAGVQNIAEISKAFYQGLATISVGGAAVGVVYQLTEGEFSAAALETVLLGPIPKVIGNAVAKGAGYVAVKVGDTIVGSIPTSLIQKLQSITGSQRKELLNTLQRAATVGDALAATESFVARNVPGFGRVIVPAVADLEPRIISTFKGGKVTALVEQTETTLYRVWGDESGRIGSYFTATKPTSASEAVNDLALAPIINNSAAFVTTVTVPGGTPVYIGTAAKLGSMQGGGSQVYIPK
jgi:hypothetical protein